MSRSHPHSRPIIQFSVDQDNIYIRFENIDKKQLNDEVRTLKVWFPDCRWLHSQHVWQMPKINIQRLALFAYERFGPNTLIAIDKPFYPQQMELPLK